MPVLLFLYLSVVSIDGVFPFFKETVFAVSLPSAHQAAEGSDVHPATMSSRETT